MAALHPNGSDIYGDTYYDEYLYEGFQFERVIYKYVWISLAIAITVSNIMVVLILLRKTHRSSTNICLICIAVTETLAILSTLPSYIQTYEKLEPGIDGAADVYLLSKHGCDALMISKFFVSKTLRLVSIWVHCYVGLQRFISICIPFYAKLLFTVKRTIVVVSLLTLVSPLVHLYQVINIKSEHGLCHWVLMEGCREGCVYIWVSSLLMNFIPSLFMLTMTISMVVSLVKSSSAIQSTMVHANVETMATRIHDNRCVSRMVIAVLISLLIPELPYGVFLMVSIVRRQMYLKLLPLSTNRAFHAAYELSVCISNLANFWIYVTMNRTFRSNVAKLFACIVRRRRKRRTNNSSISTTGTSMSTSGSHMRSVCPPTRAAVVES